MGILEDIPNSKGDMQALADYIAGLGGGSILVTDGTTTVNPATSLHLPAGTLSDLGSGVGGVGLITTLIGPFPVAFNTAGINDGPDGCPVAPLTLGSVVVYAWAVFHDEWNSGTSCALFIGSDNTVITAYDANACTSGTPSDPVNMGGDVAAGGWTGLLIAPVHVLQAGQNLNVKTQQIGDIATIGSADIYAIIATPAA